MMMNPGSKVEIDNERPGFEAIGQVLVAGAAGGAVLFSDTGLSFWGGVDPSSGRVIDRHHPLHGSSIAGRMLAIPSGRGSCTGSNVLLELLLNGHAPAALVFERDETILPLGVVIADEMFGVSIPVVSLDRVDFAALRTVPQLQIDGPRIRAVAGPDDARPVAVPHGTARPSAALDLGDADRAMLDGRNGEAVRTAMRILVRIAAIAGARTLIDVTQVHIDGCIHTGPASLRFAEYFRDRGARVRVPTSLNAISVDRRHWRAQGVDRTVGEPAAALADCYVALGAAPTFTCAPYLLDTAPSRGEQVAWSESNAVAYANSVLGARTMKYPDYLDLCVALTGRAPLTDCHVEARRHARIRIDVAPVEGIDDAFWPCLGHLVGSLAPDAIPVVDGLGGTAPDRDDLKAFSAAFATTSGAPMFHIAGVTPEAPTAAAALGGRAPERTVSIAPADLLAQWRALDAATEPTVDLVCLGNPHFSLTEFRRLAALCRGRTRAPDVAVVVTCGRAVHAQAEAEGLIADLRAFGVSIVQDTCWCMIAEPLMPPGARTLMTNSGKYAHYAPGLVGRDVHFAGLAACVAAAVSGRAGNRTPAWLGGAATGTVA